MIFRAFIGSSRESIRYAEAIQKNLEDSAIPNLEPICWPAVFQLGSYTLEILLEALKQSSFGIFVLAPDDYIEIRNESYYIPRDNVLLEMGMFIAGVGRSNTFFVYPKDTPQVKLHLPSDLLGVTGVAYAGHLYTGNVAAQVSSACVAIKNAIEREMQQKLRVFDEKEENPNSLTGSEQKKIDALRIKEYRKMIDRRI